MPKFICCVIIFAIKQRSKKMDNVELQKVLENYKKYKESANDKNKELSNEAVVILSAQFDCFSASFDVEEYRLAGDLMAERLAQNYFKQDEKELQI